MGLSMPERSSKAHAVDMAENKAGRGAVFHISLPLSATG